MGSGALGAGMASRGCPTESRPAWPPRATPASDDSWDIVRAQFPLTEKRTYLNAAGLGPAPYPVLDTVKRTMMALQRVSETGHQRFQAARERVAHFLGAAPEEIAFQRNATEGNSTVASGLKMNPGDEVIFESHAHPGGAIPWMNRQKMDGIVVKTFEPDPTSAEGNLQRIDDLITPRTRAIQVSHVTAPTGICMPVDRIAELARENDLWFHIDGAQSAGMFPFSLTAIECDSYATSGHKWLGAPHGTGILYVRKDRLDAVVPTEVGAYTDSAYQIPDTYEYHASARRYESGTRDASSVEGVAAAVLFMEEIGMERVAAYNHGLARNLQNALRQIEGVTMLTPSDPSLSTAITTFKTAQVSHDDLYNFLRREYDLRCRIVREQGLNAVRVSTHIYNRRDECDRVAEATRAAISNA